METIRFEANVPQQICLKFTKGLEVEGNYGPQVMFTLADGRRMYLTPEAAKRLEGVTPGVPFMMCKKLNGKAVRWIVGNDTPIPTSAPMERLAKSASTMTHPASAAEEWVFDEHVGQMVRMSSAPPVAALKHAGPVVDALGAAPDRSPAAAGMMAVLHAAITAAVNAEEYAERIGRPLSFTTEDIRSMAISMYIQKSKGGY